MEKEKIFIGGAYSANIDIRLKISGYAKIIEETIKKCGYVHSKNLLSNPMVHSDKAEAEEVSFLDTGESFLKVGREAIKGISEKKIENLRALRVFKSKKEFEVCLQAASIAMNELKGSIAGIYELSTLSQGSYMEIGLMIYHYQRPVLALSNEDFGRYFGTLLTGSPSLLLKCQRYNDNNLVEIIKSFLLRDLPNKKLTGLSYKLPVELKRKIDTEAREKGLTASEVMRNIVENHFNK